MGVVFNSMKRHFFKILYHITWRCGGLLNKAKNAHSLNFLGPLNDGFLCFWANNIDRHTATYIVTGSQCGGLGWSYNAYIACNDYND